jgi:LacI family transcriptional regulator
MFYGDVIQGIEMQARSIGYNIALMTMEGTTSFVQLFQQHSGSLAGLIILGVGNIHPAFIETLLSEKLPAVFVDTDARELVMPSVMPDYISGAYKATQYLLAKGYRRIAFIQGSTKYPSLLERFHGYTSALADASIPLDFALVQPSVSRGKPNKGFLEMRALLERGIHFDAVFCVTDRTALGALEALREAHVKVPNDIALLGFDNVSQVSHTSPPLTTVDVYKRELGSKAMDILSQQINSPRQVLAAKTLTPTRLVIRSST